MKPLLQSLTSIIEPGIALTRAEVLRRYRLVKGCNVKLLQWLAMLQFSQLIKSDEGELYLV